MTRYKKSVILFLLLSPAGLILKKLMIPGASLLLIFSFIPMGIIYFVHGIKLNIQRNEEDNSSGIFILSSFAFAASCITFLIREEYWSVKTIFPWIAFITLIILLLLSIQYLIFRVTEPVAEKRIIKELLIPFLYLTFLVSFSIFSTQRQFHNFFRGSTFESYVRKVFPEKDAVSILEANQCDDLACLKKADHYYTKGLKSDSLKKWDDAFNNYNKAIDYNIHFTEAYYMRATNRMLHAFIDNEITKAAIRDCDIAISLNPRFVMAYVRRGFAYYGAKKYAPACVDLKKAKELDSTLTIDKYIDYSCGN